SLRPSGRFLRFPSFPTLSDLSDPISSVLSGPEIEFPGAFRRFHYFSRFPGRLIIEPFETNSGMPK
ncbi:hypothetical protein ACFWGM_34365, partial [Streptomyces roseolus]|uniref:hypothetical protein n=1 Tax=Streptomyces roseolus TaxID=67358 RepID=UPI003652D4B7